MVTACLSRCDFTPSRPTAAAGTPVGFYCGSKISLTLFSQGGWKADGGKAAFNCTVRKPSICHQLQDDLPHYNQNDFFH